MPTNCDRYALGNRYHSRAYRPRRLGVACARALGLLALAVVLVGCLLILNMTGG